MGTLKDEAIKLIDGACDDAAVIERWIQQVREIDGLHPWAMPSLANAIGSIQSCVSNLRAARHHIETPEPPIDAEFEVVK